VAYDGSWTASDTVYEWEANSCAESKRGDFPKGDYYFPQFIVSSIGKYAWDSLAAPSSAEVFNSNFNPYNCWFVDNVEILEFVANEKIWIMWQQDAYRNCLLEHPRFRTVSMSPEWEGPVAGEVR